MERKSPHQFVGDTVRLTCVVAWWIRWRRYELWAWIYIFDPSRDREEGQLFCHLIFVHFPFQQYSNTHSITHNHIIIIPKSQTPPQSHVHKTLSQRWINLSNSAMLYFQRKKKYPPSGTGQIKTFTALNASSKICLNAHCETCWVSVCCKAGDVLEDLWEENWKIWEEVVEWVMV